MGGNKKDRDRMKDPLKDIKRYRGFLETIPLDKYREELKDIKWVEQDLPKEVLPLVSVFKYYWEEKQFLTFGKWFETFWKELNTKPESKQALKEFKKYYFDKNGNGWFKKGFKARMYRTWISVLTQLDFCFIFELSCAKEGKNLQLQANAELDSRGIDARVNDIDFQIAKISQRKEARIVGGKKKIVTIPYAVFNVEEFERRLESPRVKDKDKTGYRKALDSFRKYFIRLQNGFIVFSENYTKPILDNIDSIEKVKTVVSQIISELSGEN